MSTNPMTLILSLLLLTLHRPTDAQKTGCQATTAPLGYVGNCPAGPICSTKITCAAGYFQVKPGLPPSVSCPGSQAKFNYSGCARGCRATAAPTGYTGACAAGLICQGVACDTTLSYFPSRGAPNATCRGDGGPFGFTGCELGCSATRAPLGYVGSCPAGLSCPTKVSCDTVLGYYPSKYMQLGLKVDPGTTCMPGYSSSFTYYGCALGCRETAALVGYKGRCPAGVLCNVSCAAGYAGFPLATCYSSGEDFYYSGCAVSCSATKAPLGYLGNCPAGVSCNTTVTCAPGYRLRPLWSAATTVCPGPLQPFFYLGCEPGCNATAAPVGYVGDCPVGGTCNRSITCAAGYFPSTPGVAPTASCPGSLSRFKYSGCVPGCRATAGTGRFSGYCAAGLTCTNVSCAKGFFPQGPKLPIANCTQPLAPFELSGCAMGCSASPAPAWMGFSGYCAAGLTCTNVSCDTARNYFPAKSFLPNEPRDPSATCTSPPGPFTFSGCALGCRATAVPMGYVGTCSPGITCKVQCAANYIQVGTASATCSRPNGTFTFFGCAKLS